MKGATWITVAGDDRAAELFAATRPFLTSQQKAATEIAMRADGAISMTAFGKIAADAKMSVRNGVSLIMLRKAGLEQIGTMTIRHGERS